MIIFIKSKEEIDGFREAGKIAGKIMLSILKEINSNITTSFLNDVAIEECKKYNVKPAFLGYHGFPGAICASVNNILVHGIPNNEPLKHDDIISIDFGVDLEGFIGDTAETISVEKMTLLVDSDPISYEEDHQKLISTARLALQFGIEQAYAGNNLNKISEKIFNIINRQGFSTPVEYGGHGINRNQLHAHPFVPNILNKSDIILRPGMVFAIEPMVIQGSNETKVLSDNWSVQASGLTSHCEHTILITEDKPEILTRRV